MKTMVGRPALAKTCVALALCAAGCGSPVGRWASTDTYNDKPPFEFDLADVAFVPSADGHSIKLAITNVPGLACNFLGGTLPNTCDDFQAMVFDLEAGGELPVTSLGSKYFSWTGGGSGELDGTLNYLERKRCEVTTTKGFRAQAVLFSYAPEACGGAEGVTAVGWDWGPDHEPDADGFRQFTSEVYFIARRCPETTGAPACP